MSDCCEAGKNDGEGALPCRCSKNGGASHRTFNEQDQRGKFRLNRCGHVKVPVNEVGALFHAVSLSAPSQVAVDQNLVATDSNRCRSDFRLKLESPRAHHQLGGGITPLSGVP